MTQIQNLPLQFRDATIKPNTVDENLFDIIWTTGATVRRSSWMNGDYDEELMVDKASIRLERINSGNAPVLNTHDQFTLDDVIGVVVAGSVRIDKGIGTAQVKLSGTPGCAETLAKVREGIIRNVSAGYRVYEYVIEERDGAVPLRRAVDWEPFEISLVPIPADAGAVIRSGDLVFPCTIRNASPTTNREVSMNNHTPNGGDTPQPAPAPAPAPAAPEPASDAQIVAARAEGVKAEATRQSEIRLACRSVSLDDTFAEKLITDGKTITVARKEIINELAERNNKTGTIHSAQAIKITRDEFDTRRALVENALLHRHDCNTYKLTEGANEYRGLSLLEIGRELLEARGIKTRGMDKGEVAKLTLGLETRAGQYSTSDFPYILANVANKTLRMAYENAPQTYKPFTRQTTAPDFKNIARMQLGDAPTLDKINESGEFKRGSMADAREQYALATYGKVVPVSRQVIINDDLGAFTRLPELFGRAAADLQSDTVWGIITANATLADSVALFHATHANLTGTGTVISVASLGVARNLLRQQKGIAGRPINVQPRYLIVPTAQETLAQQFVTATNIIVTKASDVNPFAASLQVIADTPTWGCGLSHIAHLALSRAQNVR
jgi:HK97 family phage prohead protease